MWKPSCVSRTAAEYRESGVASCVFDEMVYDTSVAKIALHLRPCLGDRRGLTNERLPYSLSTISTPRSQYI